MSSFIAGSTASPDANRARPAAPTTQTPQLPGAQDTSAPHLRPRAQAFGAQALADSFDGPRPRLTRRASFSALGGRAAASAAMQPRPTAPVYAAAPAATPLATAAAATATSSATMTPCSSASCSACSSDTSESDSDRIFDSDHEPFAPPPCFTPGTTPGSSRKTTPMASPNMSRQLSKGKQLRPRQQQPLRKRASTPTRQKTGVEARDLQLVLMAMTRSSREMTKLAQQQNALYEAARAAAPKTPSKVAALASAAAADAAARRPVVTAAATANAEGGVDVAVAPAPSSRADEWRLANNLRPWWRKIYDKAPRAHLRDAGHGLRQGGLGGVGSVAKHTALASTSALLRALDTTLYVLNFGQMSGFFAALGLGDRLGLLRWLMARGVGN